MYVNLLCQTERRKQGEALKQFQVVCCLRVRVGMYILRQCRPQEALMHGHNTSTPNWVGRHQYSNRL